MRSRAKLEDVARRAGCGLATVDRVLNERGGVSPATAQRVLKAARALGLRRILPAPWHRQIRIDILLTRSATPYIGRLNAAFVAIAGTLDRSVTLQRSALDPRPTPAARRIADSSADAVAVYVVDHHSVREAVDRLALRGVPVICLTTDLPGTARAAYVGIDHSKAGRTAAFLAARVQLAREPGAALVITTSLAFRAHVERVDGFAAGLGRHAPDARIAEVLEAMDDPDHAYAAIRTALAARDDWGALYNTGGANRAVAAAIADAGWRDRLVFLGHELTGETASLLASGAMLATIDQAPELQARRATDILLRRLGLAEGEVPTGEIPFTLHTPENI